METKPLVEKYLSDLEKVNRNLREVSRFREEVKVKFLQNLDLIPMDTVELKLPASRYTYITSGTYVIVDMDMMLTGEYLCLRVRDMNAMEYDVQIPVKNMDRMIKVIRRDI